MKEIVVILILSLIYGCSNSEQTNADSVKASAIIVHDSKGENLFKMNCINCHQAFKADGLNLYQIIESNGISYFNTFILNQDSLLRAKDAYTIELKSKWGNQSYLHKFIFTKEELMAIAEYLKRL